MVWFGIGIALVYWSGILFFLTRKSSSYSFQAAQSILFLAIILNSFLTFNPQDQKVTPSELIIELIIFPVAIFYSKYELHLNYALLIMIVIVGFAALMKGVLTSRTKTKNIYLITIITALMFFTSAFIAGDIFTNVVMFYSSKKHDMDCYKKKKNFVESIYNLNNFSHAEAQKGDDIYFWSYRLMDFYKTDNESDWPFGCKLKEDTPTHH